MRIAPTLSFLKVTDNPLVAAMLANWCGGAQLRLFGDATSLGGVESLVEWRRKYDESISPLLLRMSIGLESHDDLQADLQQAIQSTRLL